MSKKVYDDLSSKKKYGTVTLAFISKAKNNISTWEITRFISDLNTYYFKLELINSISNAIKSGIKPSNIFIFNESFMLNHMYAQMDQINFETEKLSYLYYIGLPFSLVPSKKALNIRFVFRYFRSINEVLYAYKSERNPQKKVYEYCKIAEDKDIDESITILKQNTLKRIKSKIKRDDIERDINKQLILISKEYQKEYKEYLGFSETIKNIEANKSITKKQKNFDQFTKIFTRVQRPVIIAYDDKNKIGRVLCRDQLNKKVQTDSTFTLRKVIHNSPFDIGISAGVQVLLAIPSEFRKSELHKLDVELKKLEMQKMKTEIETAKIENINAKLRLLQTIKEVQENGNINQVKLIENDFIGKQLTSIQKNVISCYQGLSKTTGLSVNLDETHVNYLV